MKILILNWRDIENPQGGGAELLTQEIARRWVKWGHQVIQISAHFPGSKKKEIIDGVKIIRLGRWWNVHFLAFLYYLVKLGRQTEIIVDEVHWLPFFSALYAWKKTILFACEVANHLFFQIFPSPLALIGRLLEKIYLWLYQDLPALAISPSTKKDLVRAGFKKEKITVIPMGLSTPDKLKIFPKEKKPTLIYLGRLNKQKGIEAAIDAFHLIKQKIPHCQLWVVGSGEENYVKKMKQKIASLRLKGTKFFGFVSEQKKFKLLSKAHLLLVPSFHEGWGLIVSEAGCVGTPAVAYKVAGLKDVVKNGFNGVLVNPRPKKMAQAVIAILKDQAQWKQLQKGAIKEAAKYNWDKTARKALLVLEKIYEKQ